MVVAAEGAEDLGASIIIIMFIISSSTITTIIDTTLLLVLLVLPLVYYPSLHDQGPGAKHISSNNHVSYYA